MDDRWRREWGCLGHYWQVRWTGGYRQILRCWGHEWSHWSYLVFWLAHLRVESTLKSILELLMRTQNMRAGVALRRI